MAVAAPDATRAVRPELTGLATPEGVPISPLLKNGVTMTPIFYLIRPKGQISGPKVGEGRGTPTQ